MIFESLAMINLQLCIVENILHNSFNPVLWNYGFQNV